MCNGKLNDNNTSERNTYQFLTSYANKKYNTCYLICFTCSFCLGEKGDKGDAGDNGDGSYDDENMIPRPAKSGYV